MSDTQATQEATVFGHPSGLFMLFFAEMWERFSYYGMRALLLYYMIKGFLGFNDSKAYAVYGAYTALVYATPFIGGMLADRFFGPRRAVILGGLLMAAGHLVMTVENQTMFFIALALLICGNGFFKPNISTIVGNLYKKDPAKKDTGFTIFYMGINLGAAMSPVICGYVGETYGWHYGFGLATFGMLLGVLVFVAPARLTQILVLLGALATAIAMPFFQDTLLQLSVRIFLGLALTVAGICAFVALGKGGLPKDIGAPPNPEALKQKIGGFLRADWALYLGVAISIPVFALLVARNEYAGWALTGTGILALAYLVYGTIQSTKIERERMYVILILMFFSMLFWAFFEQAGSSVSNFTDRNIDRVFQKEHVQAKQVGKQIRFRIPLVTRDKTLKSLPVLSQEQLGFVNGSHFFSLTYLSKMRTLNKKIDAQKSTVKSLEKASDKAKELARSRKQLAALQAQLLDVKHFGLAKKNTRLATLKKLRKLLTRHDSRTQEQKKKEGIKGLRRVAFTAMNTLKLDDAASHAKLLQLTPAEGKQYTLFKTTMEHIALSIVYGDKKTKQKWTLYFRKLKTEHAQLQKELQRIKRFTLLLQSNTQAPQGVYVWLVSKSNVGMGLGGASIPASEFQATNPIFILLFGLLFAGIWGFLRARNLEPSTPVKFALGILQLGLGFGVLWYGAQQADSRGMVAMSWLLLGYLLHTTGELCLSPVGLSMVTKLSPARLVSTVMGAWFLATAFSNYLAGMIAALTGVSHGSSGEQIIPPPSQTVTVYGDVFGKIALAAIGSAVICFILSPLLSKWMHEEETEVSTQSEEAA